MAWGGVGWGSSGGSGTAPLIAQDGNVLVHVTAADLQNGTTHAGPVWTKVGVVPYNSGAAPRASVGPFGVSNYFSLPTANPIDIAAGPITIAVICQITTMAAGRVLTTNPTQATGYDVFYRGDSSGQVQVTNFPGGLQESSPTFATPTSGLAVFFGGFDGSNNIFAQLGNGAVASGNPAALTQSATATLLGSDTGAAFPGNLFELYATSTVPSHAAFNALYTQILANAQN